MPLATQPPRIGDDGTLRIVVTVLALAGCLTAGDLQLWNQTDVRLVQRGRFAWSAFGGFRLRDGLSDAYDERIGTEVNVDLRERLSLAAGYLHRWLDSTGDGFAKHNRIYVSPGFTLAVRPARVDWVMQLERHWPPGRPSYNRYRPRVEIERFQKIVTPFLSQEFLFQREGFLRSRTVAGLRWRLESGTSFEAGYLFDSMKIGQRWTPRHAIRTALSFGFPRKRT